MVQSSTHHFVPSSSYSTLVVGAILGLFTYQLPSICRFVYTNFLRHSNLGRYLHSDTNNNPNAWALVTGASDGIGRGFAEELASEGFNVILHGRNQAKLEALVKQLSSRFPSRQFDILVYDASDCSGKDVADFDSVIMPMLKHERRHLCVLVNNIGGFGNSAKVFTTLESRNAKETQTVLDINMSFPAQITRVLMPLLKANKPSLIINVGSRMGTHVLPYLNIYCGAKAFTKCFSSSLRLEMQAEGLFQEIEVLGLDVARVKSSSSGDVALGFFTPDSPTLARHGLQKVGCGRDMVIAYWPHAVQSIALDFMPSWLYDTILIQAGNTEKAWREKWE